ncbi:MAG: ABC transporter ATP-binding protein [Actinobacteria bacterium]|nr:MAG: ABC transporter ATP-binding protein [Actinomycetota bacterium]
MTDPVDYAVRVRRLTKRFGPVAALRGVDLSVPAGSVYGFLGPNGAGKTTTLRILTGLARPTSGEAQILGHDLSADGAAARAQTGFLPDVPGFYPWMTAEEFLRFSGRLFDLDAVLLDDRVRALLDLAGLAGVTTRIGGYSRGMKQRLGIAQALVNAPKVLMLDEPTSALDPMGRRDVLEMIASLRGRTTVLFSTHILADVERVCDRVGILSAGRVVAEGTLEELLAPRGGHLFEVEVADGAERLEADVRRRAWCTGVTRDGRVLRINASDLAAAQFEIPGLITVLSVPLVRFEMAEASLEDVFLDLVGGGGEAA